MNNSLLYISKNTPFPDNKDKKYILLESLLEGYAEFYSAELAEKVVRGMTENALKSKFNGGSVPFGYVIDSEQHFQIDPLTAPIVTEVFTLYSKGTSMGLLTPKVSKPLPRVRDAVLTGGKNKRAKTAYSC